MSEVNERLEVLILEAKVLENEMRMLAMLLDACPNCRVARAGMIRELDALAEKMADVGIGIGRMKEGGETGAVSSAPTGDEPMTKEAADDEPE